MAIPRDPHDDDLGGAPAPGPQPPGPGAGEVPPPPPPPSPWTSPGVSPDAEPATRTIPGTGAFRDPSGAGAYGGADTTRLETGDPAAADAGAAATTRLDAATGWAGEPWPDERRPDHTAATTGAGDTGAADDEPGPGWDRPPVEPSGRRRPWVLAAVGLVVALAAGGLAVALTGGDPDETASGPTEDADAADGSDASGEPADEADGTGTETGGATDGGTGEDGDAAGETPDGAAGDPAAGGEATPSAPAAPPASGPDAPVAAAEALFAAVEAGDCTGIVQAVVPGTYGTEDQTPEQAIAECEADPDTAAQAGAITFADVALAGTTGTEATVSVTVTSEGSTFDTQVPLRLVDGRWLVDLAYVGPAG